MVLFELTGGENNPVYQAMAVSNGSRQYDFLRSIVDASLAISRPFLSESILKALNFTAIACLHAHAGQYRPCEVVVEKGADQEKYHPPAAHRVAGLMEDFVNHINRNWEKTDPVVLATLVLWRLNHIHPFINGNGRTARAACYFVLCVAAGQWLPGTTILPELIKREHEEYCAALAEADESIKQGQINLSRLHALLSKLLREQLAAFMPPTPAAAPEAQP